MLGYLSLDIICSSKLTVFLELRSRKTVRFSEQIMSADKYPSIFSRQMKAIVYIDVLHSTNSIIVVLFFFCQKPLKGTFNQRLKLTRRKATRKYEVHKKTCRRQNRKREVRLIEFNRFSKSTHIFYITIG